MAVYRFDGNHMEQVHLRKTVRDAVPSCGYSNHHACSGERGKLRMSNIMNLTFRQLYPKWFERLLPQGILDFLKSHGNSPIRTNNYLNSQETQTRVSTNEGLQSFSSRRRALSTLRPAAEP